MSVPPVVIQAWWRCIGITRFTELPELLAIRCVSITDVRDLGDYDN